MKKIFKLSIALTSLLLCVSIVFTFPSQVFAESLPNESKTQVEDYIDNGNEGQPYTVGNIISEDVDKRDKYSKQFRLDDGSYMAVSYNMPIHFQNDSGKWEDYDNSLVDGADTSTATKEINSDELANKKSNLDISYSKETKEKDMVKIKLDKYLVSWGYKNTNKVKANVVTDN